MSDKRPCSIEGCAGIHFAHGWCGKHYQRMRNTGSLDLQPAPREKIIAKFWQKVRKTDACWLWEGAIDGHGYGTVWLDGRFQKPHRVAYELLVGPIPDGLELDHVVANGCTNRNCVKAIADEHGPAHLEPVTPLENTRRAMALSVARRTSCSRGHPFTDENTIWRKDGSRTCRACHQASKRRWAAKQAAIRS